jgi:hypothetical protein
MKDLDATGGHPGTLALEGSATEVASPAGLIEMAPDGPAADPVHPCPRYSRGWPEISVKQRGVR